MPRDGDFFSAYLAAYVVLIKEDDKVFMIKRKNTGYCDGFYCVPSGKVMEHETFLDAAVRETKEEAGVDIAPDDLELFLVQSRYGGKADKRPDWVDLFFRVRKWKGEPSAVETDKSDHAEWLAPNDGAVRVIPNIEDGLKYLSSKKTSFSFFNAEEYARGAA